MSVNMDWSEELPESMLRTMHEDQIRVLKAWGVCMDDDGLFSEDTPMSVKVRFCDFMIREAMDAEFV